MYRNNNNLGDLINRFEMPNDIIDDFDMTENLKYAARQNARKYKVQSNDEAFGNDETRSLMMYSGGIAEKIFDRGGVFVQATPTTTSGVKEFIKQLLQKISALLEMISKFPFPRMSVMSFGLTSLLAVFLAPRAFTDRALYPGFKLLFTIVYPAYRSFKAVRNKNLKEYLKWIVYWIVYAFFTCVELFTDALFNWFPFYNEIKVIFLIWILGPSTKGAMKVYKSIIHPMLISREREIDDVIQLAQEYGYMQVFRLSSKSVNYANKIIMQDAKGDNERFMVTNQLMKNISLSNISDAGTIHSTDDVDELARMRRFSLDKAPYEQHRKPSFDYRCDEMSSGYASPTQPLYRAPRGAYIEESAGSCSDLPRKLSLESLPSRKASLTELSNDEIVAAYHNLLRQQQQPSQQQRVTHHDNDDNYREFLRWMEMKRSEEERSIPPQAIPLNDNGRVKAGERQKEEEKVNTSDKSNDAINVVADETPINAVEEEQRVQCRPEETRQEVTAVEEEEEEEEFKDAISEDERDFLSVPLVITEESESAGGVEEKSIANEAAIKPNEPETDDSVVNAALTLSNDPLQIAASLSTSSMSLDEGRKRPAKHTKGRAPPPPPPMAAVVVAAQQSSNVIEGYYYDELTDRHFKETEL